MNNKAIFYARVSTTEQREKGFSLGNQTKHLRAYCEKNNFELVEEIVTNESAAEEGRKDFGRMVKRIQAENISNLVCWHTDRLSRNSDDQALVKRLMRKGVRIHLVSENQILTDADYDGKLLYSVKGALAERFIDDLRKKTQDTMMAKAQLGIFPGRARLGYKNVPGINVKRDIVQDPDKIELVKWGFERYARGGISLAALCEELHKKGLRNRNGGKVTINGVVTMLKDEFYYGYFKWAGELIKGTQQSAISKALWDEVQVKMRRNFKEPKRGKRFYPYKNLIKCGYCNSSMVGEFHRGGHNSGEYYYYKCSKFKNPQCPQPLFTQKQIEDILVQEIDDLYVPAEVIEQLKAELKKVGNEQTSITKSEQRRLQNLITKTSNELNTIYQDKLSGLLTPEEYLNWKAKKQTELLDYEDELRQLGKENLNFQDQAIQVIDVVQNFKRIFEKQDEKGKAEILGVILEKAIIRGKKGEESVFVFKPPFNYVFKFMRVKKVLKHTSKQRHGDSNPGLMAESRPCCLGTTPPSKPKKPLSPLKLEP